MRAFRLTKQYLDISIANNYSVEKIRESGLSFNKIFEELPVQIHNNHLASLFLASHDPEHFNNTQTLAASSLKGKSLASNVETLIDSVDDLNQFLYQLNKKRGSAQDVSLQEWLPLCQKVNFTANDVEQQLISDFLTETAIRP